MNARGFAVRLAKRAGQDALNMRTDASNSILFILFILLKKRLQMNALNGTCFLCALSFQLRAFAVSFFSKRACTANLPSDP